MNTSSKFAVATHILVGIAARRIVAKKDVALKSEMLSQSVNTNPVVIRRILGKLRDAGVVESQTGPEGGSWLAKAPKGITLKDIYEAVEEGDLFHMHYKEPNPACPVGSHIMASLCDILAKADSAMKQSLSKITLADLTNEMLDKSGVWEMLANGMTLEEIEAHFEAQVLET